MLDGSGKKCITTANPIMPITIPTQNPIDMANCIFALICSSSVGSSCIFSFLIKHKVFMSVNENTHYDNLFAHEFIDTFLTF